MDQREFAKLIEARRQEIVRSQSASPQDQFRKREAELTQALPIWGDFEGWFSVRSDLTVVAHRELTDAVEVEFDETKRNFVLAVAARKYPELEELKPKRPHDAVDCNHGGIEYEKLREHGLECSCGGLGWLPA